MPITLPDRVDLDAVAAAPPEPDDEKDEPVHFDPEPVIVFPLGGTFTVDPDWEPDRARPHLRFGYWQDTPTDLPTPVWLKSYFVSSETAQDKGDTYFTNERRALRIIANSASVHDGYIPRVIEAEVLEGPHGVTRRLVISHVGGKPWASLTPTDLDLRDRDVVQGLATGAFGRLADVHNNGIVQGDPSWVNLLAIRTPAGGWTAGLVDFDKCRIGGEPQPRVPAPAGLTLSVEKTVLTDLNEAFKTIETLLIGAPYRDATGVRVGERTRLDILSPPLVQQFGLPFVVSVPQRISQQGSGYQGSGAMAAPPLTPC